MSNQKFNKQKDIERSLEEIYQSPQPSNEFMNNLENRLMQTHKEIQPKRANYFQKRPAFRWATVPAVILAVLIIFVAVVGPQKVLAEMQALIGYVPGVGFVDVNDTRVLIAPVSQTQDDVTVTVKQVMVGPEETYLVLGVEGLGTPEEFLAGYWPPDPDEDIQAWQERYLALWQTDGRLILPDGTEVSNLNIQGAPWDGFYTFPSLPPDVLSAKFEVTRLPGVPADKAPLGWSFELKLDFVANPPAMPEAGESDYASNPYNVLLPEAVPVDISSEAFAGITVSVVEVVYAETETAIRLDVEGIPLDWQYSFLDIPAALTDDLGNEYPYIYSPVTGLQQDGTYMLSFSPVSDEASALTLSVDYLAISLQLEGKAVSVDFGEKPQIGDTIPLDSTVEVEGIPIHFTAVTLSSGEVANTPEEVTLNSFIFSIDPVLARDDIVVSGLMFSGEVFQMLGSTFGSSGSGGGGDLSDGEADLTVSIGIPDTEPLPTGSYLLPISEATVNILGPFEVTWEVPAK